jgi:hypothetical protein
MLMSAAKQTTRNPATRSQRQSTMMDECLECTNHGWIVGDDLSLARCGDCDRFGNDLEAALAFFESNESVLFDLKQIVLRRVL